MWCKAIYRPQSCPNPFAEQNHRLSIMANLKESQLCAVEDLAREVTPPGTVLRKVTEVTRDGIYVRTLWEESVPCDPPVDCPA
jgi:hypothetical protein